MTLTEQLSSKPTSFEVAATKLSEAMILIRGMGGWCPRMDVERGKYTLTIVWAEKKEKQEEFL